MFSRNTFLVCRCCRTSVTPHFRRDFLHHASLLLLPRWEICLGQILVSVAYNHHHKQHVCSLTHWWLSPSQKVRMAIKNTRNRVWVDEMCPLQGIPDCGVLSCSIWRFNMTFHQWTHLEIHKLMRDLPPTLLSATHECWEILPKGQRTRVRVWWYWMVGVLSVGGASGCLQARTFIAWLLETFCGSTQDRQGKKNVMLFIQTTSWTEFSNTIHLRFGF